MVVQIGFKRRKEGEGGNGLRDILDPPLIGTTLLADAMQTQFETIYRKDGRERDPQTDCLRQVRVPNWPIPSGCWL